MGDLLEVAGLIYSNRANLHISQYEGNIPSILMVAAGTAGPD